MIREQPTLLVRGATDRPSQDYPLPTELLGRARIRLGKFVLFMAILVAAAAVVIRAVPVNWGVGQRVLDVVLWLQIVAISIHLVFYGMIRSNRLAHALILNLGLVYEIVLCFAIGFADQWLNHLRTGMFQDTSFAHILIVIYPALVPSPPRRTLFTALAAGATIPLALFFLGLVGMQPTPQEYVIAFMSAAISVAIAMFGSRLIHGMNVAVARARQLGSYQLDELLGRGGMGEVWRAKHRLLARPAAIKLVASDVLGATSDAERMLKRFEREAQATATLCSPHTIQLYDFGVAEDGTFYFVMELLDGIDLQSLVSDFGPLPPSRVVHFLSQICDSLAEAHQNALIHRDVKPANVFACRYGRHVDFVKVLDFGLVKPRDHGEDVQLTQDRTVGGTPAFMAPEQVTGERPVDARTDIYAVGCVAYWLLTGQLVFDAATSMQTMIDHARTPPVPPSERTELEIPAPLEQIVLACLEKDPERRPRSALELLESLTAIAANDPWTPELAQRWWATHKPRTSAGGGSR